MKLKRIFYVFFAVVALFSVCMTFSSAVYAKTTDDTTIGEDKETLKELEAKLKQIKQQQTAAKGDSSSSQKEYENKFAEKTAIEEQISLLNDEIDITEKLVVQYKDKIDKIVESMYQSQTEIDKLYDTYDQIVVYYYENGEQSTLELLLSTDSLSSFLTKRDYVSSVLEYMDTLTELIQNQKAKLESDAETYKTAEKNLNEYVLTLEEAKAEAEEQVAKLDSLMSEISGSIELTKEQIEKLAAERKKIEQEIENTQSQIAEKYTFMEGDYSYPIASYYWEQCYISSPFGKRTSPITGETETHSGLDIAAPKGTPVQAVKSGVVIKSSVSESYGEYIVIEHADGTNTWYMHLSKRLVASGDNVLQNQIIGKVGSTGASTGNHLHFAVKDDGSYKNPVSYLPKEFIDYLDKKDLIN